MMSFIRDFIYGCCQTKTNDASARNTSYSLKSGTGTNRSMMDASLTVPDMITPVKTQPSPISWQLDLSTILSESFEVLDDCPHHHSTPSPQPNNKADYSGSTFDVCTMSNDIMAVNFEKLVQRLETATVRLEALSTQKPPVARKPTGSTPPRRIDWMNAALRFRGAMYFQSPQPYGQQAKSYRSIGSTLRAATSMTNLPSSTANDGRSSAPPVDFVTVYKQVPLENGFTSQSNHVQSIKNTSVNERDDRSRGPAFYRITREEYAEERSTGSAPNGPGQRRISRVHTTTSLQDASPAPSGGGNMTWTVPVQVPIQNCTPVPIERDNAVRLNVNPYHEDYQRKDATNNRYRSSSAVPFSDYTSTTRNIIVSRPVEVVSNGRQNAQVTQSFEKVTRKSETENSSQSRGESTGIQRPVVFQQFERHRNYATLHHVTSSKTPALQRRISDPNLLKIDDSITPPTSLAMYNVAKGVKAELEQDPKFRKKADTLNQIDDSKVRQTVPPPVPPRVSPKQSPSLRQMESFFANVQQFRKVLDSKPVPPVPAPKPFNVEHVRSIFRTDGPEEAVTSASKRGRESDLVSEKTTGSGIKVRSVLIEQPSPAKILEKNVEVIHTTNRPINLNVIPLLNVKTVSSNEPGKTVFNMQKSRSKILSNNSADIQKSATATKMTNRDKAVDAGFVTSVDSPADITALERDYDMSTPEIQPLNRPFPVEESTGSSKKYAVRAASPPGILLKNSRYNNENSTKASKRVVFQCDGEGSCDALKDAASDEVPPSIVQYDNAVSGPLQNLQKLSVQIGGDVQNVGDKLSRAFNEQRNFLWTAAGRKEPPPNDLQAMLTPVVEVVEDITAFKDSKRNTQYFNHLSAIGEGVQAVGWLTVKPTPAPFIKETLDAAVFFVNRVFKDYKDDKIHADWGKALIELLNTLQKYVREVHTTGVVWNSTPGAKPPSSSSTAHTSSATIPPPRATGAAPPPPPAPVLPPDLFSKLPSGKESDDKSQADRAALFAEINAGEEITKRLKKVTPDMQTHKNPSLRAQHNEAVDGSRPLTASAVAATAKKQEVQREPKTWLENGKQWNVEYHNGNKNILVEASHMKQTVYIYKCDNSVIQVKGKVNSITLDSCKKTSIVFESLLSQIEIINCQSVQIQTLGAMPTLSIQKTDGCQVYLSKEAMDAEIITSRSSEMNVLVPVAEDGDYVEYPIPEQFKTVYNGQKLLTTVSDIV